MFYEYPRWKDEDENELLNLFYLPNSPNIRTLRQRFRRSDNDIKTKIKQLRIKKWENSEVTLLNSMNNVSSRLFNDTAFFANAANKLGRSIKDIQMKQRNLEISRIIETRNIQQLVHFTNSRNVEMIKKYGILPRVVLEDKNIEFIANDPGRWDNHLDKMSLSISRRNNKLLQNFYYRRHEKHWAELTINPNILWIKQCLFFDTNAANKKFRRDEHKKKSDSPSALEDMFSTTIEESNQTMTYRRKNMPNSTPTSEQAEVMVNGRIEPEYVNKILNPVDIFER